MMGDVELERMDARGSSTNDRTGLKNEGRFSRQKYVILGLVVFIVGGLSYFSLDQMKSNRDMSEFITHRGSKISGLSFADQSMVPGSTDIQKYFLTIGMRQDYRLQECQGTLLKQSFPDVDYALMGYNILRGYPLATGHDPGFTYPIFAADYSDGKQTADCRYSVPKGLVVVPDVSCMTSFSSKIVQTQYELASSLSVSAHVSGGGWGVSFSASAGYKDSSSTISTGESVYIISSAKCNYYYSKLIKRDAPPFDGVFFGWIKRLNNTDEKDIYMEFFDTYGTHFATEVTFGARFTYENKMTSAKFQTLSEQGVNVAVEASYAGLFSVGGGFNMDSSRREAASSFTKSVETKTITVGAAPPANGDAMVWASTVKSSPVPSEYKLASIEALFSETYVDRREINVNIGRISHNIKEYKYDYCKSLLERGEVQTCESLAPGMVLERVRLCNHYRQVALSYKDCIDYCLKRIRCVAITYCYQCESTSTYYKSCFLYSTSATTTALTDLKWKSVLFTGKIKNRLVMVNSAIIGTARGFEREGDNTADAPECQNLCIDDAHCVASSHCECPEEDIKCRNFSFANVLGFKQEIGTNITFVANSHRRTTT